MSLRERTSKMYNRHSEVLKKPKNLRNANENRFFGLRPQNDMHWIGRLQSPLRFEQQKTRR